MRKKTQPEIPAKLMKRLRRSRELIAKEIPDLIAKDQRLYDAMRKRSPSAVLRRAIHASKLLLPDLADRAGTDMDTLDAFLTDERPLTSDVIDRLASILKLRLGPAGVANRSRSKAG